MISTCNRVAVLATVLWMFGVAGQCTAEPPASGKPSNDEDKAPTVQLVLRPAAEPKAALKYRLLPGVLERRPGNAAVMYNKLGMQLGNEGSSKLAEQVQKYLDLPLAQLPREEMRKAMAENRQMLDDLDLAARRQTCDWELPIGERDFISLLLPEVQTMRTFGRLVAAQARLQIAEGKTDEAIHTLQTGFAMARHVAEGPTLVNGLVGIAISQLMTARVEELVQQPGAPNLYWALTVLPRPLVDLRTAIETEMNVLYLMFPELADLNDMQRPAAYWQMFIDKLADNVAQWQSSGSSKLQTRLAVTALALKGYPQAKRYLIERGRSPDQVEAMPVAQVVAIYTVETYNELRDEVFKWFYVPYCEARAGLAEADRVLGREGKSREIVPLASLLLPAISHIHLAMARNERRVALVRTIEALRIYGAAHQGRLPAALADVADVPVPMDPLTGQPFVYHVKDGTAVLEAPAPSGVSAKAYGYRYEIRFSR